MLTSTMQISTPSDLELAMTRDFDAPRHLVFRAYTTPALLKRWLGGFHGWTLDVCDMDLRVGGRIRYGWRHEEGHSMGLTGAFKEVVLNERLVSTEVWDDPWYEGEGLSTVTFTEQAGRTTLTLTLRYGTKAIRDEVLAGPATTGVASNFDRLAEVLKEGQA